MTGTFELTATAGDDRTIAGVQFFVNNQPVGGEQCCVSVEYRLDTTSYTNGSVTITAEASDEAGNTTMSAPVTATITNEGAPPIPPTPVPGPLTCTGDLLAAGKIALQCVPQARR